MAHALILATEKAPAPLAEAAGVTLRALVPVGGRPVLARVLEAFLRASGIEEVVVVGPAGLADDVGVAGDVRWVEEADGTSESVRHGLRGLGLSTPVVIAPADLALLTPALVEGLLAAYPRGSDVAYPLIPAEQFEEAFPTLPAPTLRFREGSFVGGRLVMAKPQAVAMNYGLLQRACAKRRPLADAVGLLGFSTSFLYDLHLLTASAIAARATRLLGAPCASLPQMPPQLAFTLDTPEHFRLAQERVASAVS